jgi:transcriptional regulator with GAF, ATPase, and Fis domain
MEKYAKAHRDWQRAYLTQALRETNGSVSETSRRTGINRQHLYKMISRLGIVLVVVAPYRKARMNNRGNKAWLELGE